MADSDEKIEKIPVGIKGNILCTIRPQRRNYAGGNYKHWKMRVEFTPIAMIPIYGRSADNIRDHRHVTSLLHRISTKKEGVVVRPTLSFDERGHQLNNINYFVCGVTGDGRNPESFYPIAEDYIGEGGSYTRPLAVIENQPEFRQVWNWKEKKPLADSNLKRWY